MKGADKEHMALDMNGRHRHAIKPTGVAYVALVSLVALLATSVPTVAFAESTRADTVIARANDLKARISEAQAAYLTAVSDQGRAEAEMDEAQAEYDDLTGQLESERERLSDLLQSAYSERTSPVANVLANTSSISDLIGGISRYNRIEDSLSETAQSAFDLQGRQREKVEECERRVQAAKDAADAALTQRRLFEDALSGMGDEIQEVSAELSAEILSEPSKSSQMQSLLGYMQDVYDVTDRQASIIRAAYQTSYSGASMCEAWAESVYRNAGIDIGRYASAYDDYSENLKSTSKADIPAGALLYGSGSGTIYAHVGIALTGSMGTDGMDTLVIDNEGSRMGVTTLREWLGWQTNACPRNGKAGWFGWGTV